MGRKKICLVTTVPESIHAQRIIRGAAAQCEKYDYDLCVFSAMTHPQNYVKEYHLGDRKIYELINYGAFDGILLDMVSLEEDPTHELKSIVGDRLEGSEHGPVVCLGVNFKDYKCIKSSNDEILREMCRHVIEVHGKRKILILTGHKGNEVAEHRLEIFKDEIGRHGIEIGDKDVCYGNFWYSSGEELADEILQGRREMPEAVICASDHMGLGLIERMTANGVRIPEDLIVIGFEGTDEAALHEISLTSYESNYLKASADAVDYLAGQMDPEKEIIPMPDDALQRMHRGMSCGCMTDIKFSFAAFKSSLYFTKRNYTPELVDNGSDIGLLMESYVMEQFTGAETPEQCIYYIWQNSYFHMPYREFYLCLRDDWLENPGEQDGGFPEKMRLATASSRRGTLNFGEYRNSFLFDTSLMIPALYEEREKAGLYYFSTVHYNTKNFGYAVLVRDIDCDFLINLVYRNWLRFVNNALEMVSARNKLAIRSLVDEMTGLYNRRGMYELYDERFKNADAADSLLVGVADMDYLKKINDTYGHEEGDFSLKSIAEALKFVTKPGEIAVRAGGDEFYVIGIGKYDSDEPEKRSAAFEKKLDEITSAADKFYPISASVGFVMKPLSEGAELGKLLKDADEIMYIKKSARKRLY